MKILCLLRHAETENDAPRDRDRRLTPQGEADMRKLAQDPRLVETGADHLLCSPALRTRRTAALVLPEQAACAQYEDDLYNASVDVLYDAVRGAPDTARVVWLVNHNPSIHQLAGFLTAEPDARLSGYAPGTLTIFSCPIDHWSDLRRGANKITDIIIP